MKDEILIEAIEASGYRELKDVNWDDLPSDKRTALILASEVIAMRPYLFVEDNPDIVFVIQRTFENGSVGCSLPKRNLSELLKTPPYDDSKIGSYSLKEEKIIKTIYEGTGTKWEMVK